MRTSTTDTERRTGADDDADEKEESPADRYPAIAEADVRADSDLTPAERETNITLASDQATARVYSGIPSITRDLLEHQEFDLTAIRVSDEDRFGVRLTPDNYEADGTPITGVGGRLPIGCLKVLARSRVENYPSLVVSDHRPESDRNGGSE